MIERHGDADSVVFGEPLSLAVVIAIVEDVVMRQRRPLGKTGGAAGKLNIYRVVELESCRSLLPVR